MTPQRKVATFRLEDELLDGLRQVQERDGITTGEQVRRAVRAYLEQKGVLEKKKPAKK